MIDPTFRNINRLFVLSFKNNTDDPRRDSFDKYHMQLVEIKDLNTLIENKPFFDHPIKNKQKGYEKLIEMSRNNDYTTGNLLGYLYHRNYYKLISIDLSISVWAYNFLINRITRSLNIIFVDKKYDVIILSY